MPAAAHSSGLPHSRPPPARVSRGFGMSRHRPSHTHADHPAATGVVVLAAGRGERLGRGAKALVPLAGMPIVGHTLRAVGTNACVARVVVVAPAERLADIRGVVAELADSAVPVDVVAGGDTRQHSARIGIDALAPELCWAAVTDAARPLMPAGFIDDLVARCQAEATGSRQVSGVVPSTPAVDTIHQTDGSTGLLRGTPDRASLRNAQTPQVACRYCLADAHHAAQRRGITATDDAGVLRAAGANVVLVPGDPTNLKITTPLDLLIAEAILAHRTEMAER